ncbi:MAG: porin [Dechloromonas sp.]|nr:porin [Dechloromonas sp.]
MKKIALAMATAGLLSVVIPGLAQAGELDDMKATMQKLQERIAQLEAQPKAAAPAPASTAPVLSNSSLGANANVTVYGKIDLFTEYNSGGGKGDRLSLESGGLNGTRVGVKGGADINEGVRAIFQLESGIFLNKGTLAQGGRILGRQAYAGIEGKYGRLTAGRQYSPVYNAIINYDAFEQGYGSPTTDGNVSTGSTRFDNSLVYASPKFHGLSANAMLALAGETGRNSDAVALAVNYENGPFDISVAYQNDDHASSTTTLGKNAFVGVGYQIMKTKLLAGYGRAVTTPDIGLKTTRNEWMIGSRTTVTGTGQLLLSYGEGRTQNTSPDDKGSVATVGWVETIGAQSRIYGIVSAHKNSAGSALVPMGTSSAGNYTINPGDDAFGLALGYQYWF